MGVDRFIFNVWCKKNDSLWKKVQNAGEGFNLILIESPENIFNGEMDAIIHNNIRERYVKKGDWYIVCDLDEFHDLDRIFNFNDAITDAESMGASAICGELLDRVSFDGRLPTAIDLDRGLGSQFPMACHLIKGITQGANSKVLMAEKEIIVNPGHHYCDARVWSKMGHVHHFKWFGSVVDETLRRIQSYEKQRLYYRHESRILLEYIINNGNSIPLHDPVLGVFRVKRDPFRNLLGIESA
jgi:hypothetical protein